MSQASVTSYFNTRKRRSSKEQQNKPKVLIRHDNDKTESQKIFSEDRPIREVDKVSIKNQVRCVFTLFRGMKKE